MADGDPFISRQHLPHQQPSHHQGKGAGAGAAAAGSSFDFAHRLPASHAVKPTFTLLGASSLTGSTLSTTRGKENAPSGLAPSPRLVLSSSSSSSSATASASGSRRTDSLRKRRVTFSPTPLPSLHSEPRHKRVWVALGGHDAGEGGDEDDERRAGKRRRTSGVYSNNPLFLSARDAASSSSSSSPTTCDSPLFDLDPASSRSATPPTSSSSPAPAAPTRSSALRVSSAAPRSPPRPPPFRPFTVPTPSSASVGRLAPAHALAAAAAAAAAEGDATDSETESDAVQSLLIPRASSSSLGSPALAAAAAVGDGLAPFPSSPGAALLALSSSSPLPSPSRSERPTLNLSTAFPPAALRSILKPRPRTPGALLPLGSEKEANRRNARGRKHVASWESERKAIAVAAARGRAVAQAQAQGEGRTAAGAGAGASGKGKGRARDSAPSRAAAPAGAARGGSRPSRASAAASGSRVGGGAGGGRDEDDEDQQRRRRLNAGSSAAPASSSSAATLGNGDGGADDGKRIVYDLEADDPVHFRSPLLVLRASLRPSAAFPPLSTAPYDGAAPSLPPRPHPDAPPVEDDASGPSSRRRFAAPTLLSDVEQAYVFLTHAAFRLPAELANADKTLEPLRTLGTVLVRAVTRDLGNVTTFAAWVDAQPSPAPLLAGASAGLTSSRSSSPLGSAGSAGDDGELGATPSPPLEGSAGGTASQGGAKRSLSEEQMRRLRDEMGAAQAAVKCLAAMLRDGRIVALFDDDTLSNLVRLVASIPLSPSLYALVQQNLLPFVPFFLRNIQLPTAILEPLLTSTILPSLATTLSLPTRIDRHRFILGESLSALSVLVPRAALARRMLADDAWRAWLPAAWRGLWDGPKKGTSVRDRTVKLLGGVVRALTIELEGDKSEEDAKWEVERQVVAEKMGEELQALFNSILPEPHVDPEVKTWLDLLSKQLDSAQQPGPEGDEPSLAARFGIMSLLAVLPPLMRSSFRRLEQKTVAREGASPRMQVGVGPWIRPINDTQAQSDSNLLVLSTLVWSHLAYAFCSAASPSTKSWVLRAQDRRPFYVFTSILKSRQEVWLKHADDEVDEARRKERKDQARALTLVMTAITFGATVHILHGHSPKRNPAADIDPPTSSRKLEQFDFVAKELLSRYLPLATSSPPVSRGTAVLGWQLLSSIVRPRTDEDRSATLDKLVNTAFLDGQLASLSKGKQALFVASALDRALQPQHVPGWGRSWVTTRVDKVLELFEACLPAQEQVSSIVQVAIADTWRSLLLSLVSAPSSLRTALAWLVKQSTPASRHADTVVKLWAVAFALVEDGVVREVKSVLVGEKEALAVATGAWLGGSEPAQAYSAMFVSAWTTELEQAQAQDVSTLQLETVVRLLRNRADTNPGSSLATIEARWHNLAHAFNHLVWHDGPASNALSFHLATLVTAPSDITSDLHLVTLLASASADLGVEVQDNILALSEHAVEHILSKEGDAHVNLVLIARLLEVASDEAFPSLYDRVLHVLGRSVQPTSQSLRHFTIILAPSLARAQALSLALDEPDSQAFLGASLAQQSHLHPMHRPILSFDTFWKATYGRAAEDLDIPEAMVDLLSIMRAVSAGFLVPGLGDTQETAPQGQASITGAPKAAQVAPSHPRLTRTTATTVVDLSGRGYDADQSRLPAESASYSSGAAESSFTPGSSVRGRRGPSPSLGAPVQHEQDTQVVDETPKEVEVQRARESFAALTSEATELEVVGVEGSSSSTVESAKKGGKRQRVEDEVIAATDDDETPPNKGPSPTQNKRKVPARRTRSSRVESVVVETKPVSKKRSAPPVDAGAAAPAGGSKKKRKGATTRSRSKAPTESASPTPSTDSSVIIENSQPVPTPVAAAVAPAPAPAVTDSQEETLRRFFALPLDTVIEAGKRLGGSPSLKRLMDLGERAKEYFERVSSQSASSQ
ncbi:hypothetical protein JCM3775_004770 [Rhodotorula graminis]